LPPNTIDRLRRQIDRIDDEMLRLLARRAETAQAIGRAKAAGGRSVYVPAREKKILDRLKQKRGKLPATVVRAVFREVISACRSLERGIRVAYLGPEATYSHMAAREQFGAGATFVATDSIPGVFEEVEHGDAEFGVVPIENSTDGVVTHTLDRFLESHLRIAAEICLEVNHYLLGKQADGKRIRRIFSHPQGLAQCRRWIAAHHPTASLHETASTAQAAREAAEHADSAAIASSLAAEMYGLEVLAENIQDLSFNATRFAVIGAEDSAEPSGDDKTSAVFSIRDEVGILHHMLEPFADNKINLTRIESRPLRRGLGRYMFFCDLEGSTAEAPVAEAIEALRGKAESVRVLGSYPVD
jgi:chorismate mutase / prephenate dehydratase